MIAANIWEKQLTYVSDETLGKALNQCVDNFPEWPPEIGKFKQFCASLAPESKRMPWFPKAEGRYDEVPIKRMINAGAKLCERLKKIYDVTQWQAVTPLFTQLKIAGRKFRSDLGDIQLLEFLDTCPDEDLRDLMEGKL